MLFHFEEDIGHRVIGWLVADNSALEPSLHVVVGGSERHFLHANMFRGDVKMHGVHSTGMCGFLLDAETIPGLAPGVAIECYDAVTNMLVYRRPVADYPELKLFHLETQTSPIYPLDQEIAGQMQMSYRFAEFIGEETLRSLINLQFPKSLFLSGMLAYRRYDEYLRIQKFHRSILLGNPYRELAARLLQLQALARAGGHDDSSWKNLGRGGMIAEFADTDLRDPGALARAFKTMSNETLFILANPITRQLVAHAPDEWIGDHLVGVALGILADFDVVGFDDDLETFVWSVEGLIGIENMSRELSPDPPDLAEVMTALLACKPAFDLVRLDMLLIDMARQATERAGQIGAAGALR